LVKSEFESWTTLVIAHRLRTIGDFDRVVVLDEGKVVEFDSPQKLLERNSLFRTLWRMQESE